MDRFSADTQMFDEFVVFLREQAIAGVRERRLAIDGDGAAVAEYVREIVEGEAPALSDALREQLIERVVTSAVGFGPLEPLFADPEIDEIMVIGHRSVWVERGGHLLPVDCEFESQIELEHLIERMISPLGRRVDELSPICDARLPDGSRVNVVIPPLSLNGPVLTVRRFRHSGLTADGLKLNGTLSGQALGLLTACVRMRVPVLVSGGTGSGKTTTLNALSEFIPEGERIVTIEDAAELRLRQRHVVRLEARPPNLEGQGEITIRALVKTALRMRPDRIVVGEVRGGEALDMLAAMNTGHDGGLTTVHASSAAGALARIETLSMMAGVEVPFAAVRRQVATALDLVVHQERVHDGRRMVVSITEVIDTGEGYQLRPVMCRKDEQEVWSPPNGQRLVRAWNEVGL